MFFFQDELGVKLRKFDKIEIIVVFSIVFVILEGSKDFIIFVVFGSKFLGRV